jgi:putative flippase GtrA
LSRLNTLLAMNARSWLSFLSISPRELERFIKFAVVGTVGAVVDFGILNLMHKGFGWSLLAANSLSFTCAVLSNFTWNRLWTFPESRERSIRTQLPMFAAVNIIGLMINNLVLINTTAFLSRYIPDPFDYNLAKAFAILLVLFWNFGVNRVTTYRGL